MYNKLFFNQFIECQRYFDTFYIQKNYTYQIENVVIVSTDSQYRICFS